MSRCRILLAAIALALGSTSATANERASLPSGLTGAWFNPEQSGHGLFFEVLEGHRGHATWHTFDHAGAPLTLYIEGPIVANRFLGRAVAPLGMRFREFDPARLELLDWGEIDIEFDDCLGAELRWRSTASDRSGTAYGSGGLLLQRLSLPKGLSCPAADASTPVRGGFFSGGYVDQHGQIYSDLGFGELLELDGPLQSISVLRKRDYLFDWSQPGPAYNAEPEIRTEGQLLFGFGAAQGPALERRTYRDSPWADSESRLELSLDPLTDAVVEVQHLSEFAGRFRAELPGLILPRPGPLELRVDAEGRISGSTALGCMLSGRIGPESMPGSAYRFELSSSNCAPELGRFIGVAGLHRRAGAPGREYLVFYAQSDNRHLAQADSAFPLLRQSRSPN